ncbi:MAG: hypothetical protein AAGG75_03725 [Bacteroidota bacterium]
MKSHFSLYSYSIPVMGKEQAVICDLANARYTKIPKFLYEVFTDFRDQSITVLEQSYKDTQGTIVKYLNLLEERKIGLFTDTPECYNTINLDWRYAQEILWGVVDILDYKSYDCLDVMEQIINLNCTYIEIRFFGNYHVKDIEELLELTERSGIRCIDFVIPDTPQLDQTLKLYDKYMKVNSFLIYGSDREFQLEDKRIYSTKRKLQHDSAMENIPRDEFIITPEFFSESQKFNPFYNRKVCIDSYGKIKNCTTHTAHFGDVRVDRIAEVVKSDEFREMWYTCPDKIIDVRDWEFRYIWLNTHELRKIDEDLYEIKNGN